MLLTAPRSLVVGTLIAVAVAGFAGGRASVPARGEVREVQVEKVVEVERLVEVKVRDESEVRRVVVYRDRLVQPDGTRHEREFETTDVDRRELERTDIEKERVEVREVERIVERRVEVPRPDWRIGALAAFTVPTAQIGYGAIVERRIVGPLSLGLWGVHTGTVGIAMSVEF